VSKAPAPLNLPKGMPAPKTEEEKKNEIEIETKRIETKLLPSVLNNNSSSSSANKTNFAVGNPPEEALVDEFEDALVFAITNENESLERKCRIGLANVYLYSSRAKEALHYLEPVVEYYKREGTVEAVEPHVLAAECCVKLSSLLGDEDEQKEKFKERCKVELAAALDAATEYTQKDETKQAEILLRCGICLLDGKLFDKAIGVFIQASACAEKLNAHGIAARAKNRVGHALIQMKRPSDAIVAWKDELESLEKFKNNDDVKNESDKALDVKKAAFLKSMCHGNIFAAYAFLGAVDDARVHSNLAITNAKESGDANELKRTLVQQKATWDALNRDDMRAELEKVSVE
jgi:tetratricopeptide (TPR) repeat protein